jgi:uncharacterized membrane protein
MRNGLKLLGHPIHPMLIVFPLGLLVTSLIFDIIRMITDNGNWSYIAEYLIGAGVAGGLLAGIFGFIDWMGIPKRTRARVIGAWHGVANVAVLFLFFWSWFLRLPSPAQPPFNAQILSFIAGAIALVSGWLGGELVDRLGIGVDVGANANASSSLTGDSSGRRAA